MVRRFAFGNILLAATLSTLAVTPALLLAVPWLMRLAPGVLPGPGWVERVMVLLTAQIAAFVATFALGVPLALLLNYVGKLRLYTLLVCAWAVIPLWMMATGSRDLTAPLLLAYLATAVAVTFWGVLIRMPVSRRTRRLYPTA